MENRERNDKIRRSLVTKGEPCFPSSRSYCCRTQLSGAAYKEQLEKQLQKLFSTHSPHSHKENFLFQCRSVQFSPGNKPRKKPIDSSMINFDEVNKNFLANWLFHYRKFNAFINCSCFERWLYD